MIPKFRLCLSFKDCLSTGASSGYPVQNGTYLRDSNPNALIAQNSEANLFDEQRRGHMTREEQVQEKAILVAFGSFMADLTATVARKCAEFDRAPSGNTTVAIKSPKLLPSGIGSELQKQYALQRRDLAVMKDAVNQDSIAEPGPGPSLPQFSLDKILQNVTVDPQDVEMTAQDAQADNTDSQPARPDDETNVQGDQGNERGETQPANSDMETSKAMEEWPCSCFSQNTGS